MRKFFIFSLPRSGSSWLSVFLSGPGCYCYHEPFADAGGISSLADRISRRAELCVGAIDTSAYQLEGLDLTGYDKFVLLREPSQVQRSYRMLGWTTWNIQNERDRLIESAADSFPIHYEKLRDIDYLERMWDMVVGLPFDRERTEYLMEMNIQRTVESVIKRAAAV